MFDFPSAPANGAEYTSGGVTYVFNGTGWTVKASGGGGTPVDAYTKAESDANFVNVPGDTMTGDLALVNLTASSIVSAAMMEVNSPGGTSTLILRQPLSGTPRRLLGYTGSSCRWEIGLGDSSTDTGGNQGSNFHLMRYGDNGVSIGPCLFIYRVTGDFFSYGPGAYKPGGGQWSDSSDARIKDVIGPYASGLPQLKQLNPMRYTFKGNASTRAPTADDPTPSDHANVLGREFVGLVAQQVEAAMPELIGSVPGYIDGQQVNDLRTLDPSALTYALINAVKELSARVEALEATP